MINSRAPPFLPPRARLEGHEAAPPIADESSVVPSEINFWGLFLS